MKVLVANRGEIACRILHCLRTLNIPSVAVYTETDAQAMHVYQADEAFALDNYLNQPAMIAAALHTGCTAIHPGYGFLSQHATFSAACVQHGLCFIGPTSQTIALLGDKSQSRALAQRIGVPVVPGAHRCDDVAQALSAAQVAGYPVLLKAAGGGGGKGIRRVDTPQELAQAFVSAQREAQTAFADGRLLVEKYIYPARHIEVQILGDGTCAIALGERECSLQRRYQKVFEEAPCVHISQTLRQALHTAAIAVAEAANYNNAGTVEFLVTPEETFYFLEVNTRLQVEHPVTELLTGMDIVQWQIALAQGASLPPANSIIPRGHAIEARLNAEDAYAGFLPAVGQVLRLDFPHHPGLRIDTGIEEGSVINSHYDSLLAKFISWAPTRAQARARLLLALQQTVLLGIKTNQDFLIDMLQRDFFITGKTFTTTLEDIALVPPAAPDCLQTSMAALQQQALLATSKNSHISPWQSLGCFRMEMT